MFRMPILRGLLLLAGIAALSFPLPAQDPAQDEDAPIRVDVTVVNVACTVRSRKGLVRNLDKTNFRLLEDGAPKEIRYFSRQDEMPLNVALLLDVSGSVVKFIETEKHTARRFLETILRPTDTAAVFGFASSVAVWQEFTPSLDRLKSGLAKVRATAGPPVFEASRKIGGTLLFDSIHVASRRLKDKPGAKAVILISDGVDDGSYSDMEAAIRAAQVAETVVHSICYSDDSTRTDGCVTLKQISQATGGRTFRMKKHGKLEGVFASIREEIRSQYLLGFAPNSSGRAGFRKLEILTTPNRLAVNARKGYLAPSSRH
ncbi:MAG: VWA domain-containing protein [Bryobacteraceae bacterium]